MEENKPLIWHDVDMTAHNGLRGLAAVHVMVFHTLIYMRTSLQLDIQGSSVMPLFFVLSGFSLGAVYGKRPWRVGKSDDTNNPAFDSIRFWRNRFARVMPVYYVLTAATFPLCFPGYLGFKPSQAPIIRHIVINVLPINTWLFFAAGGAIDGPAWTIATLWFFWLVTPYLLPRFQQLASSAMKAQLSVHFVVQVVFVFVTFAIFAAFSSEPYFPSTMVPYWRLPVFCMGLLAGLLCGRHGDDLEWPMNLCHAWLVASPCHWHLSEQTSTYDYSAEGWARFTDRVAVSIVAVFSGVFLLDLLERVAGGEGILGMVWFQVLVAHVFVVLLIALTRDNGLSKTSRFLRTSTMQYLGKLSMCIYLVHMPIMRLLSFVTNGSQDWPVQNCHGDEKCKEIKDDFDKNRQLWAWQIPIVWVASLLLSVLLFHVVEEPARKLLRK